MPPRKKELLKPKPKGKLKASEPQSENDFLEAADDHEQAAGKWRAGDAAKATRFFNRAIDMYNAGLKQFPQSFDLAYNKANLEFNLTEDERIVPHLGNRARLLEETLQSHRFAMSLNPNNMDILFNTAQVLTALAEAHLEAGSTTAADKSQARPLLEEAVQIFTNCLEKQQQEYAQMQDQIAKAQASGEYREAWEGERQELPKEDDMDDASSASEGPGDWATVEEPLTPESILETCTAHLNALTTLLGLYDPNTDLPSMEKKAQDGLETANNRIPALLDLISRSPAPAAPQEPKAGPTLSISSTAAPEESSTTPQDDALLAAASFQASMAEVAYRSGRSTPSAYAETVERIFNSLGSTTSTTTVPTLAALNIQSAYADSLIDLASSLSSPSHPNPTTTTTQWTALTQAQTLLTTLSSPPHSTLLPPSRLASIFLARGDIDLSRLRLSHSPDANPAWVKNRPVLLANAGVFYRGGRSYAERAGAREVQRLADAKAVVVRVLKEGGVGGGALGSGMRGEVERVLGQMVEEGVVGLEDGEGVLGALR
ncbi:hypothetical protein IAQ61_009674 [Plenodomus lingam]|uniref:TPR-like protein n=1 Tax=Leptosphaeria maculans (strain JN3 / isolate v23.1.3 / race Av1-4-5-6-7-8) TaxID=985895 RepID=E4ZT53_LEPMJ|nr:hypothetical protein LEMA_P119750.1 [Plenodomus lingam JN3]KAH9863396.1 hypothetical protein IAQ61_009674 [Plenodomus lingam]CBX94484.1 hypothetical protein LEMA_P119750.1 [Plenodomus lingam JN3]